MGYKRHKKFPTQRNIRFSEFDTKFINELSTELGISFSDAVRHCVNFSFIVGSIMKEITLWDAISNISPEFLESISNLKPGDNNGNKPSSKSNK